MLSTVDQIICRLLYFRSGRFGLKSNTVSIVLGVRKVKEVMESETRVGIELLGKLKRKADKYWMSPQQRVYRASKVSCWGLQQTGAWRNTTQQF